MNLPANNMMNTMAQNMLAKTMQNNPILAMLQGMKNGQNPLAIAQQMAPNNPKIAQGLSLIQGKNSQELETMARNMCKERNVDINQFAQRLGLNLPQNK